MRFLNRNHLSKKVIFSLFVVFLVFTIYYSWPDERAKRSQVTETSSKKGSQKNSFENKEPGYSFDTGPRKTVELNYLGHKKPGQPKSNSWYLVTVPVGQGNANILLSPRKNTAVIDVGPRRNVGSLIRLLHYWGIKSIETLVLTHPHSDHIGGVQRFLSEFDIKQVWDPAVSHPTEMYKNLLTTFKKKKTKYKRVQRGETRHILPELKARIFNPIKRNYDNINNSSIVLEVSINGVELLFTGDAEKKVEDELIKAGLLRPVEVFKVAHHGSGSSTTRAFLRQIKPRLGIISVPPRGKSPYGHPHKEVLKTLEKSGVKTLKTGDKGYIAVEIPATETPESYSVFHFFLRDLQQEINLGEGKNIFSYPSGNNWRDQVIARAREDNRWRLKETLLKLQVGYKSWLYYRSNLAPKLLYKKQLPPSGVMETSLSFNTRPGREAGLLLWRDEKNWVSWAETGDSNTRLVYRQGGEIKTALEINKNYSHIALRWKNKEVVPLYKTDQGWRKVVDSAIKFTTAKLYGGIYARSWQGQGDYSVKFSSLEIRSFP